MNVNFDAVDGSEIPNNYLGCLKPVVSDEINYQPQLVDSSCDLLFLDMVYQSSGRTVFPSKSINQFLHVYTVCSHRS